MRLLVTRPSEDGEALAAELTALGHEPILAPVMAIAFRDGPALDLGGVQAILVTSRNGARALARHTARRDVPVLAVGAESAAEARRAGFDARDSGGGDVAALTRFVEQVCRPEAGALLHVAGTIEAKDLSGALTARGYQVRRAVLYESRAADNLPEAAACALKAGTVDGALFYSPRTARLFGEMAAAMTLGHTLPPLTAYCLSEAVAAAARPFGFRAYAIAAAPNQAALLALIPNPAIKA